MGRKRLICEGRDLVRAGREVRGKRTRVARGYEVDVVGDGLPAGRSQKPIYLLLSILRSNLEHVSSRISTATSVSQPLLERDQC